MFEETIESKKFLNGSDEDKCKACFPRYFRAERSRTKSYDKQYMGQRRRTDADNIKPTPYFLPPPSHPRDEEIGPKRNKHRGRMKIEKKKKRKLCLRTHRLPPLSWRNVIEILTISNSCKGLKRNLEGIQLR